MFRLHFCAYILKDNQPIDIDRISYCNICCIHEVLFGLLPLPVDRPVLFLLECLGFVSNSQYIFLLLCFHFNMFRQFSLAGFFSIADVHCIVVRFYLAIVISFRLCSSVSFLIIHHLSSFRGLADFELLITHYYLCCAP